MSGTKSMELWVVTPGSRLRVRDGCFRLTTGDTWEDVSPRSVRTVILAAPSSVSSSVLELALEHGIDVVQLDRRGRPVGRFWHAKAGVTAELRRAQLRASEGERGVSKAREWVVEKLGNQVAYLTELAGRREEAHEGQRAAQKIGQLAAQARRVSGERASATASLRGYEGTAGRLYFGALSSMLPARWQFQGRSRAPAADGFNALLNYGYGVLSSKVERAVILAGLDPHVGFMHADRWGKTSLVFDLIEAERIEVERTVVGLFGRKRVQAGWFEDVPGGVSLSWDAKRPLVEALGRRLDKRVPWEGRRVRREDVIQLRAHALAKWLREEG